MMAQVDGVRPKLGGARPGAGRKPGKVGAAKRALAEMAKDYAEAALATLAEIHADKLAPHAARVSAATALLDRGHGKPAQAMTVGNPDGSPIGPQVIQIVAAKANDSQD